MNNISSALSSHSSSSSARYVTRANTHSIPPEQRIVPLEKPSAVITPTVKSALVENVKKWVALENELKSVNETARTLRESKQAVAAEICSFMKTRDGPNRTILVSDGELRVYDKKEYSTLSYGYLEKCLSSIIPEKTHVDYIMKYVKENREITTITEIRHVVTKKERISS
jgi:hypothetical protein